MARTPKFKKLTNSKLLKEYASWIYCTDCNKTVAYLCYVTYDCFEFEYTCDCGGSGKVNIEFEHPGPVKSTDRLKLIKNRLCCPKDDSPLLSIVQKNLKNYKFRIVCNCCAHEFVGQNES